MNTEHNNALTIPNIESDIAVANEVLTGAEASLGKLVIADDAGLAAATDILSVVKEQTKKLEERRKAFVEPFNKIVAQINAAFKPWTERAGRIEADTKRRMQFFRDERERLIREEQERARREYEKKLARETKRADKKGEEARFVPPPATILPQANTVAGKVGSMSTQKVWTFEVTGTVDLEALRQYLDQEAIAKAVRAYIRAGGRTLGGVRIFQEERIAVK